MLLEENGRIRVIFDGATLVLTVVLSEQGAIETETLVLRYDGYTSLQIQSPVSGQTCGLCGNNDGNAENDLEKKIGGLTYDLPNFVDSWIVHDPRSLCSPAEQDSTMAKLCQDAASSTLAACQATFDITNFDICVEGGHDKTAFIEACIHAECEQILSAAELPPRCVIAQAYATRCSNPFWYPGSPVVTGDWSVDGWETPAGCPTAEERRQAVLDTGCPQPSLQEELNKAN